MNRKTFLKRLGIGAAVVAASPKILTAVKPEDHPSGILLIDQKNKIDYTEFAKVWHEENGHIVYSDPISKYKYFYTWGNK